ncbi:MAG: hypothetical protein RDU30_09860 [Desulfovibrionaceae bacterium]|nr:hypothetical protein [Desulfovibrionaceae bacterium]
MLDVWGTAPSVWTTAESPWLPLSATASVGCPDLTVAPQPATAVVDCTATVNTVTAALAVLPATVTHFGAWSPGASADDGYGYSPTLFNKTGSFALWGLGSDSTAYTAFFRFPGVDIPPGATVTSATWRRRSALTADAGGAVTAHCVDADDAAAPTTLSGLLALVLTDGTEWADLPAETSDAWYSSPDFSGEVQAVIDREGWEAGNALVLVLKATATAGARAARTYDSGSLPELQVEWTTPAVGDATADVGTAALALAVHPAGATCDVTVGVGAASLSLATQAATAVVDVAAGVGTVGLTLAVQAATAETSSSAVASVGVAELALAVQAAATRVDCAAAAGTPGLTLSALPASASCDVAVDVGILGVALAVQAATATADALAVAGTLSLALEVQPAESEVVNPGDCRVDVVAVSLAVSVLAAAVELVHIREWLTLRSPATLARRLSGPASLAVARDAPANLTKRLRSPVDLRAG